MTETGSRSIGWAVGPVGYKVTVWDRDRNEPVTEYYGGNNRHLSDAAASVDPDDDDAVSREKLEEFARITAGEMAEELGIDRKHVFRDEDDETALRDEWDEALARRAAQTY